MEYDNFGAKIEVAKLSDKSEIWDFFIFHFL